MLVAVMMCPRLHASSVTIRVIVLVVVVVTLVVVIKVVIPPCRMVSVVDIGGFFTTCSRRGARSRQKVLMLFVSFVRKSCIVLCQSVNDTRRTGGSPVPLRSLR